MSTWAAQTALNGMGFFVVVVVVCCEDKKLEWGEEKEVGPGGVRRVWHKND